MLDVYMVFLILSGAAMLVMAFLRVGRGRGRRIWSGILGAAFTGYGLYLLVFFQGGHYFIAYYAFIAPILLIVQFFRDRSAAKVEQGLQAAKMAQEMQAGQGPHPGYGVPQYGQPAQPGYGQQPTDFGPPSAR